MAYAVNPVSTKITLSLNTTVGIDVSTGTVSISSLDTTITAAKIAAIVAAVSPLLAYPVISTRKTDVGLLVEE